MKTRAEQKYQVRRGIGAVDLVGLGPPRPGTVGALAAADVRWTS